MTNPTSEQSSREQEIRERATKMAHAGWTDVGISVHSLQMVLRELLDVSRPHPFQPDTNDASREAALYEAREQGWRSAIEVHSRHGMAGWSSHKEAALSAPQEASKPEIASGETVDYKPSLQCTCGAEWECGQFGWEMVAAPHTKVL